MIRSIFAPILLGWLGLFLASLIVPHLSAVEVGTRMYFFAFGFVMSIAWRKLVDK